MVFHGSRLISHGFSWFQVGFSLFFMVPGEFSCFFMFPGRFSCFFMVPGCFFHFSRWEHPKTLARRFSLGQKWLCRVLLFVTKKLFLRILPKLQQNQDLSGLSHLVKIYWKLSWHQIHHFIFIHSFIQDCDGSDIKANLAKELWVKLCSRVREASKAICGWGHSSY